MSEKNKDVFFVEEIRAYNPLTKKYLVKWLDYGEEDNTWEPHENILGPLLISDFNSVKQWKWQFYELEGKEQPMGWYDYDAKAQEQVEKVFQEWLRSTNQAELSQCNFSVTRTYQQQPPRADSTFHYSINFNNFKQVNLKNKKERQTRRVPGLS